MSWDGSGSRPLLCPCETAAACVLARQLAAALGDTSAEAIDQLHRAGARSRRGRRIAGGLCFGIPGGRYRLLVALLHRLSSADSSAIAANAPCSARSTYTLAAGRRCVVVVSGPVLPCAAVAHSDYPSLSTVVQRIKRLLDPALTAREFWVRAELSSAKVSGGNLYCDLVETREGRLVSKIRCHVWRSDLGTIRQVFAAQGVELQLDDGTEVGIQCKVTFHDLHGLALRGVAFDPEVALGALEKRRREILARLEGAGLLELNAKLEVPVVPVRIGVVASRGTAGYNDFVKTLETSVYGVQVFVAHARVQGEETESTILRALEALSQLELDLVVVLRGGGSRIDLSYLDNEAVARAIAVFPVPVWTGIGHETDTSVLDHVAGRAFKTPTAVAEEIVACLTGVSRQLSTALQSLRVGWKLEVEPRRHRLAQAATLLAHRGEASIRARRNRFDTLASRTQSASSSRLTAERVRLRTQSREIQARAGRRLAMAGQTIAERDKSLAKTVARYTEQRRVELDLLHSQLVSPTRLQAIDRHRRDLERIAQASRRAAQSLLRQLRTQLERESSRFVLERYSSITARAAASLRERARALRAADPTLALARGYTLTRDHTGALIRSAGQVQVGQQLTTEFHDGMIRAEVIDAKPHANLDAKPSEQTEAERDDRAHDEHQP